MAVTKQTYTLDPTWTTSGLADTFRSAFIDAGLMTEWFDAFLSGSVENRILRVVNDATKTYGTVYYWFMFTTTTVAVHTALDWNATTHVPTGTLYQNYFSTTTNALTNHLGFLSNLATATSLTLTRYTSAINTSCTWFLLRQTSVFRFLIPFGAYNATSFVNQNITAFNGLTAITGNSYTYYNDIIFQHYAGHTRRTHLGAASLNGWISNSQYLEIFDQQVYVSFGNVAGQASSNANGLINGTYIPTALTNTHTGLAENYTPVFTSVLCSPYLPALPADFALAIYYTSASVANQDTFIVTAGTEEYEIIARQLSSSSATGQATIMFLARTVG